MGRQSTTENPPGLQPLLMRPETSLIGGLGALGLTLLAFEGDHSYSHLVLGRLAATVEIATIICASLALATEGRAQEVKKVATRLATTGLLLTSSCFVLEPVTDPDNYEFWRQNNLNSQSLAKFGQQLGDHAYQLTIGNATKIIGRGREGLDDFISPSDASEISVVH